MARSATTRQGLILLAAAVAVMWAVEVVDLGLGGDLDAYGIEPRDPEGLIGVVTAPFLHGGFGHLVGNTIPLVVLGAVIALGGALRLLAVAAIVALVSGLGTWLVAPAGTVHVGASGIVFGFATYLMARGLYSRRLGQIAVGVVVLALWGVTLLRGLVPEAGVSWQGHLFGALGGVLAARLLHAASRARAARRAA